MAKEYCSGRSLLMIVVELKKEGLMILYHLVFTLHCSLLLKTTNVVITTTMMWREAQ